MIKVKVAPGFAILTVLCAACGDRDSVVLDAGLPERGLSPDAADPSPVDGSLDAAPQEDANSASQPEAAADASEGPRCGLDTNQLDVLLLIDTSASMAEEQYLLAQELPNAVRRLATGDVDGDGKPEHKAADLRLGIITPDLGGDLPLGKCAGNGDGAALKPFLCAGASGERFLHVPAHASADQLLAATNQVSCAVQEAGTQG